MWRLALYLTFCSSIYIASAEYALTNTELEILRANNFTIVVNSDTVTLAHHGLPENALERGWNNPNDALMVNHSYTLPRNATISDPKGCAGTLGVIGLAVSGGAYYNPYTAFGWNAVEGECKEDLDTCFGHPSPDGTYHYHSLPDCLYTGDLRDKFLGVALDGYPIYGPMDATGKNWTSSDLDQCHGHYYNGRYMYRATYDFPYLISCYHGQNVKVAQQGPPGGNGQLGGNGPPAGGGNGQQPPPLIGPPGSENDPCWSAENQNWEALTCIVVCENAGRDLSNCPSRSGYTVAVNNTTTSAVSNSRRPIENTSPVGGSSLTSPSFTAFAMFTLILYFFLEFDG